MKNLLTSAALAAVVATGAAATTAVQYTYNGATVTTPPTVKWTGIPTLPDMCEFRQLTDGKMDLDESTGKWTVDSTQPAKVTVAYRGIDKISVEPDDSKKWQTSHQYDTDGSLIPSIMQSGQPGNGVIHGHDPNSTHGEVFDADVEYDGSTYRTTQDGGGQSAVTTVAASSSSFTIDIPNGHSYGEEFSGVASIEIAGTATPTGIAIYYSGDEYHTPHKITCLQ